LPETKTPETLYGGQAVIEGVMMRSPHYFAVACRKANGEIALTCESVPKILRPYWQKIPFLRGAFAIVDAMALGTKSLLWAAKIAEADIPNKDIDPAKLAPVDGVVVVEAAPSRATDIVLGSAMVIGLLSFVAMFKMLPHLGVEFTKKSLGYTSHNLPFIALVKIGSIDLLIRLTIFTVYISLISRMKHVFRVFQYHGAEHKAINVLESQQDLTVDNAAGITRLHPRCGTSFVVIVLFFSVIAISPFYGMEWYWRMLIQIGLVPIVAGVSFELLRLAGKFRGNVLADTLSRPGMWTQLLTTREPDSEQLEVAIASLNAVINAEENYQKENQTPESHPKEN
jgi:uncharacterized protein YqhQ